MNALNLDHISPASERYDLVTRSGSFGRKGTADATSGTKDDNFH
jgi:hypothetical protein